MKDNFSIGKISQKRRKKMKMAYKFLPQIKSMTTEIAFKQTPSHQFNIVRESITHEKQTLFLWKYLQIDIDREGVRSTKTQLQNMKTTSFLTLQ